MDPDQSHPSDPSERARNPTAEEIFTAMRAHRVDFIEMRLCAQGGLFRLWQDGDFRLTTPLWSDILQRLGLRDPASNRKSEISDLKSLPR
jgi:hypothetical protein